MNVARLLANNRTWAAERVAQEPDFFARLVAQQSPQFLWIGCADSRVPANQIVGLAPGEVFVHRNVANLAPPQDANCQSVLQFALEVLKVADVIVCGHYGCGGVRAAVSGRRNGLIDHWLQPIRDAYDAHAPVLAAIEDEEARHNRLCEFNVVEQVGGLARNPFVQDAWRRGQALAVHGWVYALHDGIVRDLGVTVASFDDVARTFPGRPSSLLGAR